MSSNWTCTYCTFVNTQENAYCKECKLKPDWNCLACGVSNHGSTLECGSCLAHKGTKDKPDIDIEKLEKELEPKNTWKCLPCGFDGNKQTNEWCELCGKKPPWNCLVCKTENHGSTLECANCLTHKGSKEKPNIDLNAIEEEVLKGSWKCLQCGFDANQKQNEWCELCGKKPPWNCLVCKTENHGSTLECASCLTHKGSKEKPNIDLNAIEEEALEGSWTCVQCGFIANKKTEEWCELCGKKPPWKCLVCKTENHGSTLECASCLTHKGSTDKPNIDLKAIEDEALEGSWTCIPCGFVANEKTDVWCKLCGKKPPWKCLVCKTENHGSTLECASCLTHKGSTEKPNVDLLELEKQETDPEGAWKCTSCGCEPNKETDEWCQMCGKKPPWKCLACDVENHGSTLECANCLAHKGSTVKPSIPWESIEGEASATT